MKGCCTRISEVPPLALSTAIRRLDSTTAFADSPVRDFTYRCWNGGKTLFLPGGKIDYPTPRRALCSEKRVWRLGDPNLPLGSSFSKKNAGCHLFAILECPESLKRRPREKTLLQAHRLDWCQPKRRINGRRFRR